MVSRPRPMRRALRWSLPVVGMLQLFLALILAPSGLQAQDCIDYSEYVHLAGSVDTPGLALGVAVAGSHAYIADGEKYLK